jgi:hypothetical protein
LQGIRYDALLHSHFLVYIFSDSSFYYIHTSNRSKLRGIKPHASQ